MKTKLAVHRQSGFSLIELLIVILIIGVLAAIVMPSIGVMTGSADKVKDKRNAQSILLSYTTGIAAGVVWPEGDVATQVGAVVAGQNPVGGPMASMTFQATISSDNVVPTYPYIGLRPDGVLFFDSTGGQPATGH